MADAEAPAEEAPNAGLAPNMLKIEIVSCRGLPAETKTQVSYAYQLEGGEVAEGEEDPLKVLKGETVEFEEPLAGTEHKYAYVAEHNLPPVSDEQLYRMIRTPLTLTIAGLALPATVTVPLVDLVWRPDPTPEDPDTLEYLPGWPGAFIFGWYKVVRGEGELEEGQEFPEGAEVYVKAEVTNLLLDKEDLSAINIIDFSVPSLPPYQS